jgi:hypothetical protein
MRLEDRLNYLVTVKRKELVEIRETVCQSSADHSQSNRLNFNWETARGGSRDRISKQGRWLQNFVRYLSFSISHFPTNEDLEAH